MRSTAEFSLCALNGTIHSRVLPLCPKRHDPHRSSPSQSRSFLMAGPSSLEFSLPRVAPSLRSVLPHRSSSSPELLLPHGRSFLTGVLPPNSFLTAGCRKIVMTVLKIPSFATHSMLNKILYFIANFTLKKINFLVAMKWIYHFNNLVFLFPLFHKKKLRRSRLCMFSPYLCYLEWFCCFISLLVCIGYLAPYTTSSVVHICVWLLL